MRSGLMALAGAVAVTLVATGAPAQAAQPKTPDKITAVGFSAGPGVGQLTIRWKSAGRNTTSFAVETALTTFSKSPSSTLPRTDRHARVFVAGARQRHLTLSAAQVSAAGGAPNTGNHLFFRVSARNSVGTRTVTREFGQLKAVTPRPPTAKPTGVKLRVGSFNVRSAKSPTSVRSWSKRLPEVAGQIRKYDPDVLALQELSPGRADGRSGATTASVPRQTESLVAQLKKTGAKKYQLVRTTSYVKPGTSHGSQATRILYDSSTLKLVTSCPNKTGTRQYNTSCSFDLPVLKGESRSLVRNAAYAEFQHRGTGKKFLFVSVHLDHRQSGPRSRQTYDKLRGAQMAAVYAKIKKVRRGSEPVLVAGDYNSWQNNPGGNAPHDYLISKGYYDTAAAQQKVNLAYSTYNNFAKTIVKSPQAFGNRLDQVRVTGAKGARRFEIVTARVDATRASDHNMVVADVTL